MKQSNNIQHTYKGHWPPAETKTMIITINFERPQVSLKQQLSSSVALACSLPPACQLAAHL